MKTIIAKIKNIDSSKITVFIGDKIVIKEYNRQIYKESKVRNN